MKISKLKPRKIDKPFYQDENISLTFKTEGHKIVAIECVNKKKIATIKIVKDDILTAFKKAEKFFAKI